MGRRDYFYDPKAPRPNSIRPAAAVALFDGDGRILLLRRKDNDKWTMPGGTMDFGESLGQCAVREVREETGFDIEIRGLIGTYTDPNVLIAYSDGEVRQEFTLLYAAAIKSGELTIDHESSARARNDPTLLGKSDPAPLVNRYSLAAATRPLEAARQPAKNQLVRGE